MHTNIRSESFLLNDLHVKNTARSVQYNIFFPTEEDTRNEN